MRNLVPRSLTVALALLALASCSTDTPTAPERIPAPPPGSGTSTAWNITVSVEPRDLTASDTQPATVTVQVRRADDGTVPQDGTTVVVSAGLGEFNSSGSGETTATLSLRAGLAELLYFAGTILGTDTIEARLENSIGSARVNIIEQAIVFIESVAPSSGPEGGGTRIRISGTGFSEPVRVTLGSGTNAIVATVDRVGKDSNGEFIRAFTGAVFDPDGFFSDSFETCDTDGDGTLDGKRSLPKAVNVTVLLFPDRGSDTLPNAFTYRPRDTSCRDETPGPNPPSPPSANFSFLVQGLTVQFFNDTVSEGTTTYTWDFGDLSGFDTTEDPLHTYAAAGTYTVKLRAENESGSSIAQKDVTVP